MKKADDDLFDSGGSLVPWRSFHAVVVAAVFNPGDKELAVVEVLVGYQSKPGTARIQTTREGLKKMIARGDHIVTATHNATDSKWVINSKVVISAGGSICLEDCNQTCDFLGELPTFTINSLPDQRPNLGQ